MGLIEWLERMLFGDYTGSPEGRRDFIRRRLLRQGFSSGIVDRVMQARQEEP
jgi:hypothetical protein